MWNKALVVCAVSTILLSGCSAMDSKRASAPEKYPVKPITLLVPFTAGGSVDNVARALEKVGYKYLGQPLVIVNRPGGGGTIAWNELAGAKPDGYTIGMSTGGLILQSAYGQSKYNYVTAIDPIAKIGEMPVVMSISSNGKWHSLDELVAYAKAHPREIKYGHSGLGTATHVVGEMFAQAFGIEIEQVPFRGDIESITALLGNHVDIIFGTHTPLKEHLKSGSIKALAVADVQRLTDVEYQNIPTFKELGYDVVLSNCLGIAVPKDMPRDIKNELAIRFKKIIEDAEFQANVKALGFAVQYLGPEPCVKEWALENEHLSKVVRQTGIADRIVQQKK